jgi:hypothetical protein
LDGLSTNLRHIPLANANRVENWLTLTVQYIFVEKIKIFSPKYFTYIQFFKLYCKCFMEK